MNCHRTPKGDSFYKKIWQSLSIKAIVVQSKQSSGVRRTGILKRYISICNSAQSVSIHQRAFLTLLRSSLIISKLSDANYILGFQYNLLSVFCRDIGFKEKSRVSYPHWLNPNPDTDPDPAFLLTADPDSGSGSRVWWSNIEKNLQLVCGSGSGSNRSN